MEAFVYCWTDHKTNKLYVGSHKGHPADGYICSSKYMLAEYKDRPEDFTRQIVAEGSFEDMRTLEAKILKSVNAKLNEAFYNMHENDGKFYLKGHGEAAKAKISKGNTGNKRPDLAERNKKGLSDESLKKMLATKEKNGTTLTTRGRAMSEETKKKIAASQRARLEAKRANN